MAVPSSNSHLKNTANGAFTATTEGGTILGNGTTGSVITKSLLIKDSAVDPGILPGPKALANGLVGAQKVLSGGTFAYNSSEWVMMTIATSLSGVANTSLLIPGADSRRRPIAQFVHDFGAKLLTMWRTNRFSWLGVKASGAKLGSRRQWTSAITAGGSASAAPPTLSTQDMLDPVAGSDARFSDSAANPTRAIPGELVMKTDFVDLSVATGGDFFDYKPITG